MCEQGETGSARARISRVVPVIEQHRNDSLGKHVSLPTGMGNRNDNILDRLHRDKGPEFNTACRYEPRDKSQG